MQPFTEALDRALAEFENSPTALAQAIGGSVKRQHVEYWVRCGYVPDEQCPGIERVTDGRVTCEQLSRTPQRWNRIKDRAWSWHPDGRPVLDVTKTAA